MKKATNTKAAIAANKTARKASVVAKRTATEKTHEIDIGDFVDTSAYDAIKSSARTAYTTGRDSTYKAIALAYMWYELAKGDKDYLSRQFDKLKRKTALNNYTNTVKCCFDIDVDAQASTISKYARVLGYINKHTTLTIDESSDDKVVVKSITAL